MPEAKKYQGGRTDRMYASRVGNATENKGYKFVDVYKPLKWSIPMLNDRSKVILLTGSAGGGKSEAAAQKLHAFCLTYPGATALVTRKTATAMYNSTVAFLKKRVMGRYLRNGMINHLSTQKRFEYANGSVLIYGGMASEEQKEDIRSVGQDGGVDIAWMEEATQFDESDFDEIIARMRGTATSWRQIILSTNPDAPTHWIHQRLIIGKQAKVYKSSAYDNPYNPPDYIEYLNSLRGVERERLRNGKWVMAGGLVLDRWSDDYGNLEKETVPGNVTLEADYIKGGGPVYWWVDDGYAGEIDPGSKMFKSGSHPRVFLFVQLRPDGRFAIFNESYQVKQLAPEHIREVMRMSRAFGWPKPSRVIYDKAAASLGGHLKEELWNGWRVPKSAITYNAVPVDQGNNEANTMLGADSNGYRRIIVHPRCEFLRMEMVSYKINPKTGRRYKDHDHGPDAIRMGVWDYIHGGPAEVDIADYNDVDTLPEYLGNLDALKKQDEQEGLVVYELGQADVAALI